MKEGRRVGRHDPEFVTTLNQHWVVYRADWDCCCIIPYNFWRFLTFTVLMVKLDILRQPWLNYRGKNITGCECARDYFKLFLFSYDAYFKYHVPV